MDDLKDEIKNYALLKGADLIRFASVDRLEGAPEGHRTEDILPVLT